MNLRIDKLAHGEIHGNKNHGQHESQGNIFQEKEEEGQERKKHGQHIDKENCLSLIFRDGQKAVVQVFLIRLHNPFVMGPVGLSVQDLLHTPAPDSEEHIEKGYAKNQNGNKNSGRGRQFIGGQDAGGRKDIAQEHGPRIAHKNPGGVKIIAEKAAHGTGENHEHHRIQPGPFQSEDHSQSDRCQHRKTRSQAIQPVDQVKGINKTHKPKHCKNQRHCSGKRNPEHGIQANP